VAAVSVLAWDGALLVVVLGVLCLGMLAHWLSPLWYFIWSGMSLICCCCLDSCHAGGGNIIGFSRGKTLKTAALSKYGYDTPDAIAGLVRSGKVRFALLSGRAARHTLPLCEESYAWPPSVFPLYS